MGTWLAGPPCLKQVFIPKGARWLNLQEAWWRNLRRHPFTDPTEIAQATAQPNTTLRPGPGDGLATPAPHHPPALWNAALAASRVRM